MFPLHPLYNVKCYEDWEAIHRTAESIEDKVTTAQALIAELDFPKDYLKRKMGNSDSDSDSDLDSDLDSDSDNDYSSYVFSDVTPKGCIGLRKAVFESFNEQKPLIKDALLYLWGLHPAMVTYQDQCLKTEVRLKEVHLKELHTAIKEYGCVAFVAHMGLYALNMLSKPLFSKKKTRSC
ncbi:hypothetical protein HYH03_018942 [Edaphochlamys debaryana]|uniref:Uncharacterized protein n=1 Tax=Edaphochlamys debaryana TaxID=47281 RepID=A0A835XCV6_9CHLO|nr:hypothetical protein HYH03_018942 [Edaphochlamys debaryana]|eukprot:KAG2482102.1 hypothetical protein HYH03_018942 [Edaphochlamys debaryana]